MPVEQTVADRFEAERLRLRAVATGILGSTHDADDAVQEAWLRLERIDAASVDNLAGWLTVVVSRVALDHVRSRNARREVTFDVHAASLPSIEHSAESEIVFQEFVYETLSHALDRLSPLETATFVLHDLFSLPFDEISSIIERSPEATRKLASRARRKIPAGEVARTSTNPSHRAVVEAFFAAAQTGNLERLIALLAPTAALRADRSAAAMGIQSEIRGNNEIAGQLLGKAHAARIAWIDGAPGAVWAHRRTIRAVFQFDIIDGTIQEIRLRADEDFLSATDIEVEPAPKRRPASQQSPSNN